jgi:hypothetical protein
MHRTTNRTSAPAICVQTVLLLLCLLTAPRSAFADFNSSGGLKVIDYPGGGQIVYGPLSGVSAMPQAVGFMLRTIHTNFGDRPQVGRFFQARGSSSVATFFTVTAKNKDGRPIAGLLIVSMPAGAAPAAAILYDEQKHFNTSANAMMKKLNEVWHPEGAAASVASGSNSSGNGGTTQSAGPATAAALRQTPFPDNSGSIGLPTGWHITGGNQGSVHAQGPNGEQIHYGVIIPILDPNNPQTRQSIMMQTQGGRIPLPGSYIAYPAGRDPVRAFTDISAQNAQKTHHPAPTYHITSTKDLGNSLAGHCTRAIGDVDAHDGVGVLATNTLICMSQPMNGQWRMTLYQDDVRPNMVVQQQATMDAIGKSYKLNGQVIAAETQSNINQIHQIGANSMRRAAESNAAFDQRNAARNAASTRQDQHNSDFSNYILDQTVIRDTQTGKHTTAYNTDADSLVKSAPNHYEYVPTQDMMRGIDY